MRKKLWASIMGAVVLGTLAVIPVNAENVIEEVLLEEEVSENEVAQQDSFEEELIENDLQDTYMEEASDAIVTEDFIVEDATAVVSQEIGSAQESQWIDQIAEDINEAKEDLAEDPPMANIVWDCNGHPFSDYGDSYTTMARVGNYVTVFCLPPSGEWECGPASDGVHFLWWSLDPEGKERLYWDCWDFEDPEFALLTVETDDYITLGNEGITLYANWTTEEEEPGYYTWMEKRVLDSSGAEKQSTAVEAGDSIELTFYGTRNKSYMSNFIAVSENAYCFAQDSLQRSAHCSNNGSEIQMQVVIPIESWMQDGDWRLYWEEEREDSIDLFRANRYDFVPVKNSEFTVTGNGLEGDHTPPKLRTASLSSDYIDSGLEDLVLTLEFEEVGTVKELDVIVDI